MAVDLGTTNIRSILFDAHGQICGQAFRKQRLLTPTPAIAEEDPVLIWKATLDTMKKALETSKIPKDHVGMISFSSQMHGVVLTERDGTPLTNLIT